MGPPSRFRERGGSRFGHRGALEPAREHLDRLGERVHPASSRRSPSCAFAAESDSGSLMNPRLPRPDAGGQGPSSLRGYSEVPSLRPARTPGCGQSAAPH